MAAFIVGEFDLTHGALVAQSPERFGIDQVWQVEGDQLGTGLFYEEAVPSKTRRRSRARSTARSTSCRRGGCCAAIPWAGSLSTAHTVFYYERYGKGVLRSLARRVAGGVIGARAATVAARFDLAAAARRRGGEAGIWHELVRVRRAVSRAAYLELAAELPSLRPRARRYRLRAGVLPTAVAPARRAARGAPARGRRSSNRMSDMR